MATVLEAGLMAANAYHATNVNGQPVAGNGSLYTQYLADRGWVLTQIIDETASGGDYAVIYVNSQTSEVFMAGRGTASWGDVVGPDQKIALDEIPQSRIDSAYGIYQDLVQEYDGYKIFGTGHSLDAAVYAALSSMTGMQVVAIDAPNVTGLTANPYGDANVLAITSKGDIVGNFGDPYSNTITLDLHVNGGVLNQIGYTDQNTGAEYYGTHSIDAMVLEGIAMNGALANSELGPIDANAIIADGVYAIRVSNVVAVYPTDAFQSSLTPSGELQITQTTPDHMSVVYAFNDASGRVTSTNAYDASGASVSTTIYSYDTDGSYQTLTTNYATGRSETDFYNASGTLVQDVWQNAIDGSHGNDAYGADGSVNGVTYGSDGSYVTYSKSATGYSDEIHFDTDGIKYGETLISGATGEHDVLRWNEAGLLTKDVIDVSMDLGGGSLVSVHNEINWSDDGSVTESYHASQYVNGTLLYDIQEQSAIAMLPDGGIHTELADTQGGGSLYTAHDVYPDHSSFRWVWGYGETDEGTLDVATGNMTGVRTETSGYYQTETDTHNADGTITVYSFDSLGNYQTQIVDSVTQEVLRGSGYNVDGGNWSYDFVDPPPPFEPGHEWKSFTESWLLVGANSYFTSWSSALASVPDRTHSSFLLG